MDSKTAEILSTINSGFYYDNHASFSATRKTAWPGWERCLALLEEELLADTQSLSVFDLACGNLRFRDFLISALPGYTLNYHAVDNCDLLVPQTAAVSYQNLDILDTLQKKRSLKSLIQAPPCDLCVCFGFLHHVPLQEYREALLSTLVELARPGGCVIVSFWQYLSNVALAAKARDSHQRALEELGLTCLEGLGDNDLLLGWADTPGAYRYCHSFSDPEIDHLLASIARRTTLLSRFTSDGRGSNLNTYVVFRTS
ncbi:MAG: class I SAM-dependent methyltransferase [Coriobacteriia bacterium]|nr:class I SAM-dependent methyltransferase [Coriobacteriia bacterium]